MSIYLRGKSWYYDFIHKGVRYTGSFGAVSRTVAKEELARKKAEVVEGRLNPAKARKSPRFAAFADEYLDWMKANRKPLTVARVGQTLERLKPFFGPKKLSELTPWHLEQFKKARREEGKAPGTVNLDVSVLKALLSKAQDRTTAQSRLTGSPRVPRRHGECPGERARTFLGARYPVCLLS
jgi:Phage integrase, N-terminal SAM-like domain